MNKITKIAFFAIDLILIVACTTTLNPQDFDANLESSTSLKGLKPLFIKAKLVGVKDHELSLLGGSVIVNEDQFTQVLADRLTRMLKLDNTPKALKTDRSIEIQVVKVSLQPDRTIYCVIDFNRKLGANEFYGFQSRAKHWNFKTACEDALNNAVSDILLDHNTISYLRGE